MTKELTKQHAIPKTAGENKRTYQSHRLTALSQIQTKKIEDKFDKTNIRKSFDKKIVSETELGNDKISYFGEFRIFVDKEKVEEKPKPFHRNSIFNRDKSRNSKKSKP